MKKPLPSKAFKILFALVLSAICAFYDMPVGLAAPSKTKLLCGGSLGARTTRLATTILTKTAEEKQAPSSELDHVAELKSQLNENAQVLNELRNSDRTEYRNRMRFMNQLRLRGNMVYYKDQLRPLQLVRIGFRNISVLNSDLLTISHTERFLELYYREFHKFFTEDPSLGGIVLHRYNEFYIMTPANNVEMQWYVNIVNQKMVQFLQRSRPEGFIRYKGPQFANFTWANMMLNLVWHDFHGVDLAKMGLSEKEAKEITAEELFRKLVATGFVDTTFRTAKDRFLNIPLKEYTTFEDWARDAQTRANYLKAAVESVGQDWKSALRQLHELAGDFEKMPQFQKWFERTFRGTQYFEKHLITEFQLYIFDWQVANFFSFSDNPNLAKRRPTDPKEDWSALDTLPQNSAERRRVLLERAKYAHYVIATDLKGLGLFKRMEQDRWIREGARKEDIPNIFNRLNIKLRSHFNALYREIKQKVGPKKGAYIYVSGDDAFILLPQVSKKNLIEIDQLIKEKPLRINDLFQDADPIFVYSSGIRAIKTVGDSQAIAEALAWVRDYLFNMKKQLKEAEERQKAEGF